MSQEKETEVQIPNESKPKSNNKKKKDYSNKQSYGFIKTVDENNQTGTISMGKSKEAIFHFKECGKFTPTVGQNVIFSLLEVGKNDIPLAMKLELGTKEKPKENKKESEVKKEERSEKKPKREKTEKKETESKKKDQPEHPRKESENSKKDHQIAKKEHSDSGKKEAYDVDKLISMEKELKSKLTHLDSVIDSVTKERDEIKKYLQITNDLIEISNKPILSPNQIKEINMRALKLISEEKFEETVEILNDLSSDKIYNDVLFPIYQLLYKCSTLEMPMIEKILHLMYSAMKLKNKLRIPIFQNFDEQRNLVIKYNRILNLRNFNIYLNIVNIIVEKSPVMMSATLPQLGKAKYDILTKCQSYISMLLISNPKLCYKMNSILQIVTGKLEEKENSTSKELRQESLFQLKKQKTQETNTVVEENEEEEGDEEETIEEVNEIAKKMNELVLEEEEDEEEEEEEELDVETSKLNISHEDEFSEITTECREISTKLIPSKEVLQKKEELRSEIETIMCNITKEKCTAYIYGSSESSFGLKGSDLDLCVRIEGCYLNNDVKAQSQLLQLLHDAIEDGKISKNLKPDSSQLIKSSRVPVVKIKDEKRNLECDVCIDNFLAVLNTRMLKTYSLIDDRLRQLVILIKLWAKNRNIADAANGSLSSYSYALLAIFYLQQTEPPILPSLQALATNESLDKTLISEPPLWNAFDCSYFANLEKLSQYWKPKKNTMSIGELLNGFFDYYLTTFDFSTQQSSVRIGKPLPKKSGMAKIAIEDPFERRDLGKVLLDEVADIIIEEFRRAKTKLSEGAKFNEICEAVDGEKINRYAYVKQDYVDHLSMEEMEEGLKSKKFYYGVLRVNKQRFREAYVTVSEFETDILIEDFRNRNRAIHGDIVVIQINEEEKNKHQTGFVVGIKEKKSPSIFAGAIMKEEGKSKGFRWLLPLEKAFPKIMIDYAEFRDFFNTKASNAEDLVIVAEMMPWKVNQHYPKGKLRGNLGIKRDLWAQKRSIMFQAMPQLYDSIYRSKDEEKHSAKIEKVTEIEEFDKNEYEDWRDKCIFTIDPLTSRDLDDAVSVEKIDNETFKCYVVIADVSKFVEEGTTTDLEAQKRGTSVYMVDTVEHMLEPTLSQNLCSLLPGVTRFGVAVNWIMKSNGDVDQNSVEFHRVVMKSCVKLDYDTVQEFIDGKNPPKKPLFNGFSWEKIKSDCLTLNELGKSLRKKRKDTGSLFLQRDEYSFDLNEDGYPIGVKKSEHSESHQLIEEFMLLANQLAAKEIYEFSNDICILRSHDAPDSAKLTESLTRYVNAYNTYLAKEKFDINPLLQQQTKPQELMNMLFEATKDNLLVFNTFQHAILREMRLAQYSVPPDEGKPFHFALNVEFYTHFTSPIRRYADLIVHRLLLKSMKKQKLPDITKKDFKILVDHINDQANKAKHIQEQCLRVYSCMYLIPQLQEGVVRIDGVILSLGRRSFTVLIPSLGVELKVQIMKRFDPIPDQIEDFESTSQVDDVLKDEEEGVTIEKLILTWNETEENKGKVLELHTMKSILLDIDLDFTMFPIDFYAYNIWEVDQPIVQKVKPKKFATKKIRK